MQLFQAAGKVEERVGNYSGARDLYSASLHITPSAPALVAFALLELNHPESEAANYTKVKRLFGEALLLDPRHGPAYNAYGNAELRHGNVDAARRIFERGVRAGCADAASLYHGYAMLELALGNVDTARDILIKGQKVVQWHDVGMDSPHRERALFLTHTLGMLELKCNRAVDALAVFKEGVERYGNSSQLLLGAALCEVKLGREDAARVLFERSVQADNKHAQAWHAWGQMEMRAGSLKSAKTLFECGIKSSPRYGALWQAYGMSLFSCGTT
jgi:tetratricopeptide (TPR) repeat protein